MVVNSVAGIGQRGADIDASVGGARIHVEVKRVTTRFQPIALFDASVKRDRPNQTVNEAVAAMARDTDVGGANLSRLLATLKKTTDLQSVVDFYRESVDPTVGMAGDPGTPITGKMPRVSSSRKSAVDGVLKTVRKRSTGNNYLAVHVASTDETYMFCLSGHDVFEAGPLPTPSRVFLDTYGRVYGGATRVAIRAVLSPESYK